MSQGFWNTLKRPFVVLAPMADVTDAPFRHIIAKYGKPDVIWTEFVSVNGLLSKGKDALMKNLMYSEAERPIIAQIFGDTPEKFTDVAEMLVEMGFDGIDINMGCPDRNVEKQGGGASLIKDPIRAKRIIRATKKGAGKIPVSVKTRIGYNKNELEEWLPMILEEDPAVVTIHARTRKEMSKVPARWEHVARAVLIRDERKSDALIIGNGDITSLTDAYERIKASGADGAMIGRGIFGNPWLFSQNGQPEDIGARLAVMIEHTQIFEEMLGGTKSFAVMKKHYKAYAHGFDGAKELRMELMEAMNSREVEGIVHQFLRNQDMV